MAIPFGGRWLAMALVAVCAAFTAGCGGGEDGPSQGGAPPAPPAQSRDAAPPVAERPETDRDGTDAADSDERAGEPEPDEGRDDSDAPGGSGGSREDGSGDSVDPDRPDGEGNDLPPPAGSPAERFERYCERNPRECY